MNHVLICLYNIDVFSNFPLLTNVMKIHRFLLLTGLLFVFLFVGHGMAEAKDQWVQVRSKNFVLIGNASVVALFEAPPHILALRATQGKQLLAHPSLLLLPCSAPILPDASLPCQF